MSESTSPHSMNAKIYDRHASLSEGLLSDFWQMPKPETKLKGLRIYSDYLVRAWRTVLVMPITTICIFVSLLLLAGFLLIVENVDKAVSFANSSFVVSLYVKDSVSEQQLADIRAKLESNRLVSSVVFVSKVEAMSLFRTDIAQLPSYISSLGGSNPFPASFDVTLRPVDGVELSAVKLEFIESISSFRDNVDDLVFGNEWLSKVGSLVASVRMIGFAGFLVIFLIVVFLIASTIRLVFYSRRDEIEILQLVGASSSYLRLPYLLGGVMQGLVGAGFALSVWAGVVALARQALVASNWLGLRLPEFSYLSLGSCLIVMSVALFVGLFGSRFALSAFMRV